MRNVNSSRLLKCSISSISHKQSCTVCASFSRLISLMQMHIAYLLFYIIHKINECRAIVCLKICRSRYHEMILSLHVMLRHRHKTKQCALEIQWNKRNKIEMCSPISDFWVYLYFYSIHYCIFFLLHFRFRILAFPIADFTSSRPLANACTGWQQ